MENEETKGVEPTVAETTNDTSESVDKEPTSRQQLSDELSDQLRELKEANEKLESELGSLKRDYKKATKSKKSTKEEQPDESLLEKAYLRSAGITEDDEVDLAIDTAKKWDVSVDKLVDDEDFKVKLDRLRTSKANETATSGVRGEGAKSEAKNTPEYWIAKGTPPTRDDIQDTATRRKVNVAFFKAHKNNQGKKFYSD